MSIPIQIMQFLDSQRVMYRPITHRPAYTAQELAHAEHVSGKRVAKTVMVMADGRLIMAVVPASHHVDLTRLRMLTGADVVRLAAESEFAKIFPGCELGAMPPFGNLYDIAVWVDPLLEEQAVIDFNAGTHRDTIRMSTTEFERVVAHKHGSFAELN